MHALEYFQQIYVINLPHRHDRRREMAEQLGEIGLGFDCPRVRLFEASLPQAPEGFPSIGARGCFLSHLGVLRDARERRFERILILEDDVNFAPDFGARIGDVIAALENIDWSVFYGGYVAETFPQPDGHEVVRAAPSDLIYTTHFIGFCGSAIDEAADFLETMLMRPLGDPRGGPMHVDGAYNWFRCRYPSKITLLSVPQLGYQRSSRSDISPLRWFDQAHGIRVAIGWIRGLKNWARL